MQKAVPAGEGAMAALIGVEVEAAREIAEEAERQESGSVCALANDNAPGQVVVSGHREAVERAAAIAADRGRRAIMLPVSAPFHCPLMAPAAEVMQEALEEVALVPPVVPLVANVSASPSRDPETIKRQLVEQVTAMVRWRESILYLRAQEVEEVVEIGAGRVLSGLTKRIDRELAARSLGAPDELEAFAKTL
jgi:[acyl-carrier-protein] S-malonyltransferase